jgi:hypothetical protein
MNDRSAAEVKLVDELYLRVWTWMAFVVDESTWFHEASYRSLMLPCTNVQSAPASLSKGSQRSECGRMYDWGEHSILVV